MSMGVFVWDSSGRKVFDGSVKTSRLIGHINVTTNSGSYTVPSQIYITKLFAYWAGGTGTTDSNRDRISISGNTITWSNVSYTPKKLYYGDCSQ